MVFIDKNHPPDAFTNTVQHLNSLTLPKTVMLKKIAIVPELSQELDNCPFSIHFILKCYLRVRSRTDHLTLSGEDPFETANILFGFMKAFRGFKTNALHGADIQTFDFVGEQSSSITFSQDIGGAIRNCLSGKDGSVKEFVQLIEAYREFWGDGQSQSQSAASGGLMPSFLEKIFTKPEAKPKSILKP